MRRTIIAIFVLLMFGSQGYVEKPAISKGFKINHANNELESSVRIQLSRDSEISYEQLFISADATKRQIALSGTLKSEALRERALNLAKSAQPGLVVIDELVVRQPQEKTKPKPKNRNLNPLRILLAELNCASESASLY